MPSQVETRRISGVAGAALARYIRVVKNSSTGVLDAAGTGDANWVGVLSNQTLAANEDVAFDGRNSEGTMLMVAGAAISAYATVYAGADGKLAASGTVILGVAMEAATADGDEIEVLVIHTHAERSAVVHGVSMISGRTWNDLAVNLPAAAAADDMGLVTGTFLTDGPTLQGVDAGGTTETQKAAFLYELPNGYLPGQSITLRINAEMAVISDGTATIDAQVVRQVAPTVDICATAATTINSATAADVDFTITPTNVVVGEILYIVLTMAVTDSGNAAPLINGVLNSISLLLDVKG